MADTVYTFVKELLDNTQYLEALKKAEAEEAKLAGLRTAGGTAAVKAYKAVQAEADKAAKAQENAAKGPSAWTLALQENSAAVKAASQELSSFRGQINLGAESLGKVGAALGVVEPELATLVGTLQKVVGVASAGASGMELLGSALTAGAAAAGTLLIASAPLIGLWHDHTEAVEASARAMKIWNDVQDDGLSLVDRAKASTAELALERSGLTDAQKAEQKLALDWQKSLKSANDEIDRQIRMTEAQIGMNDDLESINAARRRAGEDELEVIRKTSPQFAAQTELLKNLREEKEKNTKAAKEGLAADRELVNIRRDNDDADRQLEQAEKDIAEAKKKAEKASKDAEKARADEAEVTASLVKAEEDRVKSISKGVAALRAQEDAAKKSNMTAEESINAATEAALAQADATARAALREAETAEERKEIEQALADARVAINMDAFNQIVQAQAVADQKRLEMEEKAAEDAQKIAEDAAKTQADLQKKNASEISEAYSIASDALGDYFDSVLSASEDKIGELEDALDEANENGEKGKAESIKKQLAAEKEAATKAFEWQQTLSAANATVNWLEALVKATTYGPVGGPLVAGAATLAYGLSLKQIESQEPSFTDTPAGGYRFGGGSQSIRGATNDTAILFRDPLEGIQQAMDVLARRQAPTSTAGPPPRDLLGVNLARTPVGRLLTRDAERLTRGRLPGTGIGW